MSIGSTSGPKRSNLKIGSAPPRWIPNPANERAREWALKLNRDVYNPVGLGVVVRREPRGDDAADAAVPTPPDRTRKRRRLPARGAGSDERREAFGRAGPTPQSTVSSQALVRSPTRPGRARYAGGEEGALEEFRASALNRRDAAVDEVERLNRPRRRKRRSGRPREQWKRPTRAWGAVGRGAKAPVQWTDGWMVAEEVKEAWVTWLMANAPWDWFVTLTFKRDTSLDVAHSMLLRWVARLAAGVRSESGPEAVVSWACAAEPTHQRRWHLHLLMKAPGLRSLCQFRWQRRWEGVGGGLARIFEAKDEAVQYLAKYSAKHGTLDAGGGDFARWQCSGAVGRLRGQCPPDVR